MRYIDWVRNWFKQHGDATVKEDTNKKLVATIQLSDADRQWLEEKFHELNESIRASYEPKVF